MGYQPLKIQTVINICLVFWIFGFGFQTLASAQVSFDPLTIGLGARALGMGKTCVAFSESGDTIFSNPAGLGEIDSFQFVSMGGKLLDEVNYTVLGGVYPLGGQSAVGIGYVGSFLSGIELRNSYGTSQGAATYGNYAALLSFAKKIGTKTSLGFNLKYYLIDGSEINDGDGNGWNVDIGLLQSDLNWIDLGVVGQNLIRANKINYQNGEKEDFPLTYKLGAKMYLLGSGYKSALYSPWEFNLALDLEWGFQEAKSTIVHLGAEFSPIRFLTIRAGLDNNTFTSGVSLKIAGLGLHYAYQPLAQYFSITFDERGWPPESPPDTYLATTTTND